MFLSRYWRSTKGAPVSIWILAFTYLWGLIPFLLLSLGIIVEVIVSAVTSIVLQSTSFRLDTSELSYMFFSILLLFSALFCFGKCFSHVFSKKQSAYKFQQNCSIFFIFLGIIFVLTAATYSFFVSPKSSSTPFEDVVSLLLNLWCTSLIFLFPFYVCSLLSGATKEYYCLDSHGNPLPEDNKSNRNRTFVIWIIFFTYLYRLYTTARQLDYFNTIHFPLTVCAFYILLLIFYAYCLAIVFRRTQRVLQIQKRLNFAVTLLSFGLFSFLYCYDFSSFITALEMGLTGGIFASLACLIALFSLSAKNYYNASDDF